METKVNLVQIWFNTERRVNLG